MFQTSPTSARRVIVVIAGSLTAFVALLSVLGFFGGLWWGFDLTAHFRVQYLALLLPGVAVLSALRRWSFAVVGGAALVINLVLIAPLYVARPAAMSDGADTLEIISFNVTASHPNRPAVIEFLRTAGADLIFLHESSTDWEDAISRAGLPYEMVSGREPGSAFGTLALVRAGDTARVLVVGDFGQWSIEVTTSLDGQPVKVLGTHPLSPVSSTRAAARDEQLRLAGRWATNQETPVVVTGDFNASPWSYGFSLLVNEADLLNSQRGYGVQASWPAGYPPLAIPIDHLVHSSELTTVDRRLSESLGSDHYPLWVTIGSAET